MNTESRNIQTMPVQYTQYATENRYMYVQSEITNI